MPAEFDLNEASEYSAGYKSSCAIYSKVTIIYTQYQFELVFIHYRVSAIDSAVWCDVGLSCRVYGGMCCSTHGIHYKMLLQVSL